VSTKKLSPERLARAEFFDKAQEHTGHLSVASPLGDRLFIVETWDQVVARSLFVKRGRNEMRAIGRAVAILERHGRSVGGTFVDCGANIGTTTIPALDYFDRAIAFEPEPRNVRLLRANLVLNDLFERVVVHAVAVSDVAGEAMLRQDPRNAGGHELSGEGELSVPTVTLDEAIPAGEPVGMIWMDIQGHEPRALAGATRFDVPVVIEVPLPLPDDYRRVVERYEHAYNLRTGDTDFETVGGKFTDLLLF
jgi:FkbM family methyltransferase